MKVRLRREKTAPETGLGGKSILVGIGMIAPQLFFLVNSLSHFSSLTSKTAKAVTCAGFGATIILVGFGIFAIWRGIKTLQAERANRLL